MSLVYKQIKLTISTKFGSKNIVFSLERSKNTDVFFFCTKLFGVFLTNYKICFQIFHRYFLLIFCFSKQSYNSDEIHAMNYEKVQKYLKSLQNAGVTNCDLNGYQNYINNAKLHRQRSMMSLPQHHQHQHQHHPHHFHHAPIYAPASVSSGHMANARMYTLPHSYQSNYYQDYYYTQDDERKSPRDMERSERRKKTSVTEDANLSYTGVDRDLADSYLKSIEAKDHHQRF